MKLPGMHLERQQVGEAAVSCAFDMPGLSGLRSCWCCTWLAWIICTSPVLVAWPAHVVRKCDAHLTFHLSTRSVRSSDRAESLLCWHHIGLTHIRASSDAVQADLLRGVRCKSRCSACRASQTTAGLSLHGHKPVSQVQELQPESQYCCPRPSSGESVRGSCDIQGQRAGQAAHIPCAIVSTWQSRRRAGIRKHPQLMVSTLMSCAPGDDQQASSRVKVLSGLSLLLASLSVEVLVPRLPFA